MRTFSIRSAAVDAACAGLLFAAVGWPTAATIREVFAPGALPKEPSRLIAPAATSAWDSLARPTSLARNTLELVALTEAIALPIGIVAAFLAFRTDLWGRKLLVGLATIAVFVPLPLTATAWLGAFGNEGRLQLIGTRPILVGIFGAAFIHAAACAPWVFLIVGIGLMSVEPELEESALMDLDPIAVSFRVTLRRALGSIAAAALAVAVLVGGDMTVTDKLLVRTFAEEAYTQAARNLSAGPSAITVTALPPLLVLGPLIAWGSHALSKVDPARLASASERRRIWSFGRARLSLGAIATTTAVGFFGLPIFALVWRAGRLGGPRHHWKWTTFRKLIGDAWLELAGAPRVPFLQSGRPFWRFDSLLETTAVWSAVAAATTTAAAWWLAWRARESGTWRAALVAIASLLLAAPGPVAGLALVLGYRNVPAVYSTPIVLVFSNMLRTLPYALAILWPSLRSIPEEHLETATLEGLDSFSLARRVATPFAKPAAFAAFFVCFTLALGELPSSSIVELPGAETIAKRIWQLLHTGVEARLSAMALVLIAVAAAFAAIGVQAARFLFEADKTDR